MGGCCSSPGPPGSGRQGVQLGAWQQQQAVAACVAVPRAANQRARFRCPAGAPASQLCSRQAALLSCQTMCC